MLGIEAAANASAAAEERNVPTEVSFFGEEVAAELRITQPLS